MIDTSDFVKRMTAAGIPAQQADAIADGIRDQFARNVVTSTDLGAAVDRIDARFDLMDAKIDRLADRARSDLATTAAELRGEIAAVRVQLQLLQWMVGLNFAATLGVLWKLLR